MYGQTGAGKTFTTMGAYSREEEEKKEILSPIKIKNS